METTALLVLDQALPQPHRRRPHRGPQLLGDALHRRLPRRVVSRMPGG